MDDSDCSASDTSETILAQFDDDELPHLQAVQSEIVEDLTDDDFLSDEASIASLTLNDGSPVIKPRPYQLEMVEESLKRNIIVAVWALTYVEDEADSLRWTQVPEKLKCAWESLNSLSITIFTQVVYIMHFIASEKCQSWASVSKLTLPLYILKFA